MSYEPDYPREWDFRICGHEYTVEDYNDPICPTCGFNENPLVEEFLCPIED